MSCPRCQAPLPVTGAANEVACAAGCGTWLPRSVVMSLIGDEPLPYLCPVDHAAAPLPAVRCPSCATALTAVHPEVIHGKPLALGVCAEHGVWLERATRADFERVYVAAITRHAGIEDLVAALKAGDDASLRKVATRIVLLEERLRETAARRRG